jgi:hypothetical protein
VSGLPAALSPWAAPLAPFASDLAIILGGFARRIAAALGPFPARVASEGEPDGVTGLARRGSYDRLLLSEWLLAQELPDEFIRRAAAGEHLFLDRSRRGQSAARRSVALLDAGPDQLGAPRIAQLALLVALASRAQAAGVELEWGIAQALAKGLVRGFGADSAKRFLEARTDQPPSAEHLAAWTAAIGPGGDELWLAGGPALLRFAPPGASRLLAEDVTEPSARQVRLALEARGSRREVRLDLPPRPECTRLLRDPFRNASAKPSRLSGRIAVEAGIQFAPNGRRAVLRLLDGDLLEVPIPNSPRAAPGRARCLAGGPGLLGLVHRQRRRARLVARVRENALVIEEPGREPLRIPPGLGTPLPRAPGPSEPLGILHLTTAGKNLWILDAGLVLHRVSLASKSPPGNSSVASTGVVAFVGSDDCVAYLVWRDGELEHVFHSPSGRISTSLGTGSGRAFLSANDRYLLAAECSDGSTWSLRDMPWRPRAPPMASGRLLSSIWHGRSGQAFGAMRGLLAAGRPTSALPANTEHPFTAARTP